MLKLRKLFTRSGAESAITSDTQVSDSLEPEIGFKITIARTTASNNYHKESLSDITDSGTESSINSKIPELNVDLIAARHLPTLFGFKIIKGYQVKVKLFPGSERLYSSIQTNSWPKFNEHFCFLLAPDHKSSFKHHSSKRYNQTLSSEHYTPEEILSGQFVVFTVYSLLELPPTSFNRISKTYRSFRDRSSNFVQKIMDGSGADKDSPGINGETQKPKRKTCGSNPDVWIPSLTISESKRNIGSVTCYLEPKLFKRDPSSDAYVTDELWLPIKDIAITIAKTPTNNLANAPKGIIELILEIVDLSCREDADDRQQSSNQKNDNRKATPIKTIQNMLQYKNIGKPPTDGIDSSINNDNIHKNGNNNNDNDNLNCNSNYCKNSQWNRLTSEVGRKMDLRSISKSAQQPNELVLRVTTARMRCTSKVKDELEATAGSVYVKTSIFDNSIYMDSWKSSNFYPSLSTKWNVGSSDAATMTVPLRNLGHLESISITTTLATKTKMGKKLVLGTMGVSGSVDGGGINKKNTRHFQQLRESPVNHAVAMWHPYL